MTESAGSAPLDAAPRPHMEELRFRVPGTTKEALWRRSQRFDSFASFMRHVVRVYLSEHRDD